MKIYRKMMATEDESNWPSWISAQDVAHLKVFGCINYLAKDEIQTNWSLAIQLIDAISLDIIASPKSTYLILGAKDGIFAVLLKIRLMKEMQGEFSSREEKERYILHHQVYVDCTSSIASVLTRKFLYGTTEANDPNFYAKFSCVEGNVRCIYGKDGPERKQAFDGSLYKEVFGVKFDAIIGNPPYQESDGGYGASASPVYNKFVTMALKLDPRYIAMIIPFKIFALQGKGTAKFGKMLMSDRHIKILVDFTDSTQCFPGVAIRGGVCYFVRDNQYNGPCDYTCFYRGKEFHSVKYLDSNDVVIRFPLMESVVTKLLKNPKFESLDTMVSPHGSFGLNTNVKPYSEGDILLRYRGGIGPFKRDDVTRNADKIDEYQVYFTRLKEGAMRKDGQARIFLKLGLLPPKTVCTQTYMTIWIPKGTKENAEKMLAYLKLKPVRALISVIAVTQQLNRNCFSYVPVPKDGIKTDKDFYAYWNITDEEAAFIDWLVSKM